ncbi:hypothetical protein JTB14_026354 [Gonioctena quinquepunctata]|nr:hypothetical protein JTB14_026354 [Gonioctena quinquepunctata]
MVDIDKITSDEAYALLSTISSDGESEVGESDNSDSDPDEDFLANNDLGEPAIVVFSESEGEDREGYGEDRQDEADDDAGQNINGSNSAHDSDCSEDDILLSLGKMGLVYKKNNGELCEMEGQKTSYCGFYYTQPGRKCTCRKKEKDGSFTQINCSVSVKNYRRCMGGEDRADMHKSYYEIDRKSRKW